MEIYNPEKTGFEGQRQSCLISSALKNSLLCQNRGYHSLEMDDFTLMDIEVLTMAK